MGVTPDTTHSHYVPGTQNALPAGHPRGPEARSAPLHKVPGREVFEARLQHRARSGSAQGPCASQQSAAKIVALALELRWGRPTRRGSVQPGCKTGKPSLYASTCGILRPLAQCVSSVTTTNPRSPGSAIQETHPVASACLRTNQPIIIMTVVIVGGVCLDLNRDRSNLIGN